MHELLKPYVMEGLSYIERGELVNILKETDGAFFLDDLNYLTIGEDCLCGYIPGTDVSRNFSYLRMRRPIIENGNVVKDRQVERLNIITCRDLDMLERFLDIYYKKCPHVGLSVNLPARFLRDDCDAVEAVTELIKKYGGYYKMSVKYPPIYDYRFPDPANVPAPAPDPKYRVENELYEGDMEEFREFCYTLYKNGEPLFHQSFSRHYLRLGMRSVPVCDRFNRLQYDEEKIKSDDMFYLLSYAAHKFTQEGHTVKNIALNHGFDNDEMCERLGMTKYRSFITLVIPENIGK